MPLAQDQRAMLQLLLERGQSYEDIASLLGGSRDDVRRRARAALEELGGQDPDREIGLTDYMLGQADPIGRADAVRHLQSDPDSLALAEELSTKLRLIAPEGNLPDLPEPKRGRRGAASPLSDGGPVTASEGAGGHAQAAEPRSPLAGLSLRQSRLFAAIGASALILLFVILAIAGVFGGDDESTPTTTAGGTDAPSEDITTVTLRPQGGGDASGEARFGIANETQPFVEFRLAGLEPAPEGDTYVIWFLLADDRGYPLAPIPAISEDGTFNQRFPIPQAALPVAVRTQFVDIALVDNRSLAGDIERALQGQEVLLDYSGESVLRGKIPRIEAPPDASELEPPGGAGAIPEGIPPEGDAAP